MTRLVWVATVAFLFSIPTALPRATEPPPVTVQGTLKGYFLSPDGTLSVQEVPFTVNGALSASLPPRLYPLWAGYYLQATIQSFKPFQSLWLLSGNGRLLWRRHYPEGAKEASIPHQEGWLGLRGQDGLSLRLLVRFVDGREQLFPCQFPCRFERVLPLKVDWLDFLRIAEVAHLLKERGKEIWEGFTLEGIPFLLEGDEGQWLLINHPRPPKGFVRYKGPLPKVPFRMTVYVGEGKEPRERREEWGGWAEKVNGVWTAALRYFPNWWVLQDCAPHGYTVIRQPDAAYRLETVIHEAFHVWWFQRVGEPNLQGREKKGQAITVEWAERECLARALEAEKGEEKRLWVKAFLEERKRRRILEGANEAEVNAERWEETVEGTATFVGWRAMQEGKAKDYQPLSLLEADEAFYGYLPLLEKGEIVEAIRAGGGSLGVPHAIGLAQILLLSGWKGESWREEVMRGRDLEVLLAEEVGDVRVDQSLLTETERVAEENFRKDLERTRGDLKGARPPKPHVTVWISLPVEVVRLMREMEKSFGNPLIGLCFPLPDMAIRIAPPVWVVVDELNGQVGVLWDANKQLMVLHRPDGKRALVGDGLEVSGKIEVTWDEKGVHVRPENKTQKPKGSALAMVRKKGWYVAVLPVALLAAIASRDTKALQEQETIVVEGTITGVFLNGETNQLEMVTLPVPSAEEDYYWVDGEEYILRAAFTPSWDPSNPTTQDFVIAVWVTYFYDAPPGEPKMVWNFQIKFPPDGQFTIGGKPFKLRVQTRPCPCVGGKEIRTCLQLVDSQGNIVACYPIKKIPAPGQLLVKVYLADLINPDTAEFTVKPFPYAVVEAYRWNEKNKQWEYKVKVKTDGNGEALFPELDPGEYQLRGYKTAMTTLPTCPVVTEEVTVQKGVRNITGMYFVVHKPIKGRVMELTSDGKAIPLPGAKAYLYKGDQQLSGPWESDSDGYFFIPSFAIDRVLAQYGSGKYTVKVIPPSRSMLRPEPMEGSKEVTLTKCERLEAMDTCPRGLTEDTGIFYFTYEPAFPGGG